MDPDFNKPNTPEEKDEFFDPVPEERPDERENLSSPRPTRKQSWQRRLISLLLALVLLAAGFLVGWFVRYYAIDADMRSFLWALDVTERYYYPEDFSREKVLESAGEDATGAELLSALNETLDDYSKYYSPEEYADYLRAGAGQSDDLGIAFLKRGFSLQRAYKQPLAEGLVFPGAMVALVILLAAAPAFIIFSKSGPGSQHAPWLLALAVALVVGALAQRSRLCMVGGIRDAVLFQDFRLVSAFIAIIVTVMVGNLLVGNGLTFSFTDQPVAHNEALWNLLGMVLVGWGSVLLGGCPLRQLILAGEGNTDSAITVTGFVVGAAVAHNFSLASSATGIGAGPVALAVACGFVVLAVISVMNLAKVEG